MGDRGGGGGGPGGAWDRASVAAGLAEERSMGQPLGSVGWGQGRGAARGDRGLRPFAKVGRGAFEGAGVGGRGAGGVGGLAGRAVRGADRPVGMGWCRPGLGGTAWGRPWLWLAAHWTMGAAASWRRALWGDSETDVRCGSLRPPSD